MKRIKRHKIKREYPESSSYSRELEEHDLAYYIHDRVELMHQVFSCLKYKEIKAMAPECVRNLAVGDLQELCTEELLGISSKRLLATLDGAEPPSDTESSSGSPTPDPMETISLDSISSDEEILSQSSKKKKHKHRRNSKSKRRRDKAKPAEEPAEASRASRAGLTVLELLELQARARAIRAQLQNEQTKKRSEAAVEPDSNTDDEVEIKEEAPDVVEISSGDEKPDLTALQLATQKSPKPKEPSKPKETAKPQEPEVPKEILKSKEPVKSQEPTTKEPLKPKEPQPPIVPENSQNKESPTKTITRKSSELTITVPKAKTSRKIKLNRNKVTITVPNVAGNTHVESRIVTIKQTPKHDTPKEIDKLKKKQKKTKKKKSLEKEGSDHDEITLQLSDSEKMDLLEDLNEKTYDRMTASTSDSESSSSDSEKDEKNAQSTATKPTVVDTKTEDLNISANEANETEKTLNNTDTKEVDGEVQIPVLEKSSPIDISDSHLEQSIEPSTQEDLTLKENHEDEKLIEENIVETQEIIKETCADNTVVPQSEIQNNDQQISVSITENVDDRNEVVVTEESISMDCSKLKDATATQDSESNIILEEPSPVVEIEKVVEISTVNNAPTVSEETPSDKQKLDTNVNQETVDELINTIKAKESEREVSEGELSDRESSEVVAVAIEPEVVCISDDEMQKSSKKKKKKDKKAKKEKKSKKSKQDFREGADQNFYKETDNLPIEPDTTTNEVVVLIDKTNNVTIDNAPIDVTDDDDDVYEILELSDDSSCYEVEGTVLSKEPTAEEIEALSARIDEIKREDVVIDEEIQYGSTAVENDTEQANLNDESEPDAHMSWKSRYLDSNKVKKVLTTAHILNAMRKKNRELKRKMDEAKKEEKEIVEEDKEKESEETKKVEEKFLEEGSIEHYQTLQASSKYVNPVTERVDDSNNDVAGEKTDNEKAITKEMKKDAKQLLKMFRRLLNSKKVKRREKKKKRKQKKKYGNTETAET